MYKGRYKIENVILDMLSDFPNHYNLWLSKASNKHCHNFPFHIAQIQIAVTAPRKQFCYVSKRECSFVATLSKVNGLLEALVYSRTIHPSWDILSRKE